MSCKVLFVAALALSAFGARPASADLVGFWNFDGSVADQTVNGNNGAASNLSYSTDVPAALTASNAQSGTFNGTNTKVEIAVPTTASALYLNNTETVTLWMKGLNTAQSGIYRRNFSNASGTGLEFQEDDSDPTMSLRIDTSGGTNQLFPIGATYDGNWHFIAIVLNGNQVTTYRDGSVVTNGTFNPGSGFGSTNPITFGNSDQEPSDWFTGSISNAAIYNAALTQDQISALNSGASPTSVPEPSSIAVIGAGTLGMLAARRRRRPA